MTWHVIFTKKAQKQINDLDKPIQSRMKKALLTKLMVNPSTYLEPLVGEFVGYYKFRVGDYRLICSKEDEKLIVIILKQKKGSCTQSTLLTLTNMSKASLSRLLQELEQRNIIRKEQQGNKKNHQFSKARS